MKDEKATGCAPHPNWFFEMSRAFGRLLEINVKLLELVTGLSKECSEIGTAVTKLSGFGVSVYDDVRSFPESGDVTTVYFSRAGGTYLWDEEKGYYEV